MFINPHFYTALILACVLFLLFYQLAKRVATSHAKQRCLFVFALLLGAVSFSIPLPYLLSAVGENVVYTNFRSLPATELLILLNAPLGAFIAFELGRNKNQFSRWLIWGFCLLGVLTYISLPFIKPIIRPFSQPIGTEQKDGVTMQTTPSTYGPASLSTLLKQYNQNFSEAEIAKHAYSSASGTENWYLARYAKSLGYSYQFMNVKRLDEVPTPAIIGVRLGSYGHFITLLSREGDQYKIADSLSGMLILSSAEFEKRYVFTGFVLKISP